MDIFGGDKKASVTSFLSTVVERVFGPETVPAVDKKMQNLAQKQANIRAVSVRQGFQAIAARSDEMAQRIAQYSKQRNKNGEGAIEVVTPIDPPEQTETIVLSSNDASGVQPARAVNA